MITFLIGAVSGYMFYRLVGCQGNTWGVYQNVWSSVIFGAVFGYLLLSPLVEKLVKYKKNTTNRSKITEKDSR